MELHPIIRHALNRVRGMEGTMKRRVILFDRGRMRITWHMSEKQALKLKLMIKRMGLAVWSFPGRGLAAQGLAARGLAARDYRPLPVSLTLKPCLRARRLVVFPTADANCGGVSIRPK